jgi:hypothetical protein
MNQPVIEHFRLWLRAGLSGCQFAKTIARKSKNIALITHDVPDPPEPERLNSFFDDCARSERAAFVLFPSIRFERELLPVLYQLGCDPRWEVRDHSTYEPYSNILYGLEWKTAGGDVTDTMGFGPFGAMPVSRRAPYVALAAWPGGRSNALRGTPPTPAARRGQVSFLDAAHGLDDKRYQRQWSDTTTTIAELMIEPPDDAKIYRKVAFSLSRASLSLCATGQRLGRYVLAADAPQPSA